MMNIVKVWADVTGQTTTNHQRPKTPHDIPNGERLILRGLMLHDPPLRHFGSWSRFWSCDDEFVVASSEGFATNNMQFKSLKKMLKKSEIRIRNHELID
ncbi:hypothetical protein F8M41_020452 [Gigaspora margarita]|uniref:Uncharacterized protein n=1 Tax=Gigaspora margarita TaxID=4874 RepID=A0A8H4EJU4_GIGMA|nr:hypothetical protein F8M41_020452 [Gigaspora margarita]